MKKIIIALAAAAAVTAAVSSAAEAKIHVNGVINLGLPGVYVGPGYGYGYGYGPTYVDDGYYGDEDCGWTTVKKVKWINGHKVVKFKKQWVCY